MDIALIRFNALTLGLGSRYWFVSAYLILMLFAPALNAFAAQSSERQFRQLLLLFLLFIFPFAWRKDLIEFNWGISGLQLMFVYLIGRYVRLHGTSIRLLDWLIAKPRRSFSAYLLLGLGSALYLLLTASLLSSATGVSAKSIALIYYSYTSPLSFAMSLCFFLGFIKLRLPSSRIINGLAVSTLAVYLLHWHPLIQERYTGFFAQHLGDPLPFFIALSAAFILLVFFGSLLIDKLYVALWDYVLSPLYDWGEGWLTRLYHRLLSYLPKL